MALFFVQGEAEGFALNLPLVIRVAHRDDTAALLPILFGHDRSRGEHIAQIAGQELSAGKHSRRRNIRVISLNSGAARLV